MRPTQFYETHIVEADSGLAARAVIVPTRSFLEPRLLREPKQLMSELGFEELREAQFGELPERSQMPLANRPES
jgi:hypothetical protein